MIARAVRHPGHGFRQIPMIQFKPDKGIIPFFPVAQKLGTLAGNSRTLIVPAIAFNLEHGTVPELYNTAGTNASINTLAYDDAYGEIAVIPSITIPSDLNNAGTITFRLIGWPKTAAADKVIQMRVLDLQLASGTGDVDTTMSTAKDSGNLTIDSTQDRPVIYSWTETVSNLGWVAGRRLSLGLSRVAPASGTNLTGDFLVEVFEIEFPTMIS